MENNFDSDKYLSDLEILMNTQKSEENPIPVLKSEATLKLDRAVTQEVYLMDGQLFARVEIWGVIEIEGKLYHWHKQVRCNVREGFPNIPDTER